MRKIYYLKSCNSCIKIIKQFDKNDAFTLQNIKEEHITDNQLDEMKRMAGSYETLFSRRSMKYRSMGLGDKVLSEKEYRNLILKEYTYLRRPVIIIDNEIFIGNGKNAVQAALAYLEKVK